MFISNKNFKKKKKFFNVFFSFLLNFFFPLGKNDVLKVSITKAENKLKSLEKELTRKLKIINLIN